MFASRARACICVPMLTKSSGRATFPLAPVAVSWCLRRQWLERDDPGDPFVPVTDDVKQKFDDAVLLFDAEMRAEGNFNWRQVCWGDACCMRLLANA